MSLKYEPSQGVASAAKGKGYVLNRKHVRYIGAAKGLPGQPAEVCPDPPLFIDNLLVRIHCIIVMIRWTGLAPWEFEFPCPVSLTSTHPQLDKGIQTPLAPWEFEFSCPDLPSTPRATSRSLRANLVSSLSNFRRRWSFNLYWMSCFQSNNDATSFFWTELVRQWEDTADAPNRKPTSTCKD